jgi:pimeloyl-ACP methyl ester carboxylesterase
MTRNIRGSELVIFEGCAHAALYEKVEEFNQTTVAFLQRQAGLQVTV